MNRLLAPPTRVSRLYPIFSLTLAITTSIFFYAWQRADLELSNLGVVEQRNQILHNQVDTLQATQKTDQATLDLQKKKIADTVAQLQSVQQKLQESSDQLATTEAQLSQAKTQLQQQQDQLNKNATEIDALRHQPPLFSFQNKSSSSVDQAEADIKETLPIIYSYIQKVYGEPYLLSRVTITFVDKSNLDIQGATAETIVSNGPNGLSLDIHLTDFNKDSEQALSTLTHELIHSFHGKAVIQNSAFEEGMTVAATDAVMSQMIADGKIPHFSRLYLIITDDQYKTLNSSLVVYADSTRFYANPDVSEVYQLIGKAWYQLYQQDPDFFKKVNAAYYPKVEKGVLPDRALILDSIRSVATTVNGQPIDQYLANNQAFNPL